LTQVIETKAITVCLGRNKTEIFGNATSCGTNKAYHIAHEVNGYLHIFTYSWAARSILATSANSEWPLDQVVLCRLKICPSKATV